MNNEIQIAASLMCCNPLMLANEIKNLERAGCDGFHVDIMDGVFVKNFAMSIRDISYIRQITSVPIDVHLMIYQPAQYVRDLVFAGANRIIIHPEACDNYIEALQKIRSLGIKAGLAISPDLELDFLNSNALDLVDTILVMAVTPGFAGQPFIPKTLCRVSEIQKLLIVQGYENILIEVDGAISTETAPALFLQGARKFVAGSAGLFFNGASYKQALQKLLDSILLLPIH